jgi:NAD(P)H-flavin reductase
MQSVRVLENTLIGTDLHHLVLETRDTDLDAGFTVPGQYVQLTVGEERPAYMAIASAPGAGNFEFLIQSTDGTAGAICATKAGGEVLISAPMGKGFHMETLANNTPLFFVTGTGISAIRSVIESRDWTNTGARLYYGTFTPADMAYQDKFDAWSARGVAVTPLICEPEGQQWSGATGFVQDAYANEPVADASKAAIVLCGAKIMCEKATEILVKAGMPPEHALTNY